MKTGLTGLATVWATRKYKALDERGQGEEHIPQGFVCRNVWGRQIQVAEVGNLEAGGGGGVTRKGTRGTV